MIRYLFLAVGLLIAGCAEFSKFKISEDGYYRFKAHPIEVEAPRKCLRQLSVDDRESSVDFTLGAGYWMAFGQYAVQVYPIPGDVKNAESFLKKTEPFAKHYIETDRESMKLNFRFKEGGPLDGFGQPAYRAIGEDPGKAIFVATFVLHRSRITIASLVYPLDERRKPVPWSCYEAFAKSVRERDSSASP